jgi:cytoskeletal protein RodZ
VEFGAAMRDMRVAHNADLATVATTLRIRQVYLQAIEDGRFDELPGPTYASGFVRAYAEYLGLDIGEVMRRYRDVTRGGGTTAPLVAPSPVSEGRMPTGFILLVAAVLAGLAYGSWYYLTLQERDAGEIVASLPQRIADMVGLNWAAEKPVLAPPAREAAAPPAVQPAARPAPLPRVTAPPRERPAAAAPVAPERVEPSAAPPAARGEAPIDVPQAAAAAPAPAREAPAEERPASASVAAATAEARPSPAAAESTAAGARETAAAPVQAPESTAALVSAPAVPPAPPAAARMTEAGRIVLRATAISWVELRDAEGRRVFSRLLKKGETYNVPPQRGITLATGNAGAIDILVDGQVVEPIGAVGAVRRDVLLEPDALRGRTAAGQ